MPHHAPLPHRQSPGLLRAAGLTALAAAGFTGLTLLAARALLPGPAPLPDPAARVPGAMVPADPVLTPRIQQLAALPVLDPAQRAEAEAWLEAHGRGGSAAGAGSSAAAISIAHALRDGLRRSAARVAELRLRLRAYDNPTPVAAMRAELAELAALAPRPDAEIERWLAKDARVQSLQGLLATSDRNSEPDAALAAAAAELAVLIGAEEPLVAAWQDLIARWHQDVTAQMEQNPRLAETLGPISRQAIAGMADQLSRDAQARYLDLKERRGEGFFSLDTLMTPLGPRSFCAATTRSSFSADTQRANTASPIRVSGTPRSRAETPVHLPVPFCPAVSRIFATSAWPSSSLKPRMSRVISIR